MRLRCEVFALNVRFNSESLFDCSPAVLSHIDTQMTLCHAFIRKQEMNMEQSMVFSKIRCLTVFIDIIIF